MAGTTLSDVDRLAAERGWEIRIVTHSPRHSVEIHGNGWSVEGDQYTLEEAFEQALNEANALAYDEAGR